MKKYKLLFQKINVNNVLKIGLKIESIRSSYHIMV